MVNKNDFGAELRADIGDQAFLRDTSVERDLLDSLKDICPTGTKFGGVFSSLGGLLLEGGHIFFAKLVGDLILLLETVNNSLHVGRASDDSGGSSQVGAQEGSLCLNSLVVLTIDEVEELLSRLLVGRDNVEDFFLDMHVGDTALEGTISFSFKFGADALSKLGQIDNLTVCALGDDASDERLATEGLSNDDTPIGLVTEVLVEGAFIPFTHGLQTVFLLEEGVNGLSDESIVTDLN